MSLLPYLLHSKIKKENGKYTLIMRTEEGAEVIREASKKKGIDIDIEVIPPPRYYKSEKERLDYWLQNNEIFKELYETLSLKLL